MVDDEIEKRLAKYAADAKARVERMQAENDLGIYDGPLHIRVWLTERSARMSTKH
jgi:hypothetical protein